MVGRVFADEEEWGSDLSFRIRRRRTRFGTSHPALIGRHAPFPVTHQAAERWHTAYFLVGGNEMTRQRQQVLNTLSIITCGNDKAIKVSKTMWLISQKIVQEELYVLNRFRCMMNSLLALGSNAVHKLWQWSCDERNPSGKLRQPPNGILMTNERSDNNPEEATACIALSKNDSYATSASGGKVSLKMKQRMGSDFYHWGLQSRPLNYAMGPRERIECWIWTGSEAHCSVGYPLMIQLQNLDSRACIAYRMWCGSSHNSETLLGSEFSLAFQ
ncbi:hypothetical protein ZIOFF_068319 [Zingiber officinale]|uniref:Uncharacterized protein n=1 Tax=Zingiber officinale TaxID=94328 RepID=A0A8J5CGI0_ZINOF|nr:hypothetical protein ZIOFF_068319 [Zingiber officinale]